MARAMLLLVTSVTLGGCASRGAGERASLNVTRCVERTASSLGFHLRRRQPDLLVLEAGSEDPVEALYVTIASDSAGRQTIAMVAAATYDRIYAPFGGVAAPRDRRLGVRGSYLERRDSTSAATRNAAELVRSTCRAPSPSP